MKAIAVRPGSHDLSLIETNDPVMKAPDDVLVRVLEVGVCGTDREICAFEYGQAPSGDDWLVIGHEALGEVIQVGQGVRHLAVGDLVVPTVRRRCPHGDCRACAEERQDFCFTGDFMERGINGLHGFMTERIVEKEGNLVRLPERLRSVGVLVEPLTIAEKAIAQVWQVQSRLPWSCPYVPGKGAGNCHRVLVLGAGPVGLLGAMAFAAAGFEVFVYAREAAGGPKGSLVESFGGRYISAADTPAAALGARVGAVDVVYEATGASHLAFDVLGVLGANAVFVFTGVPGRKGGKEVDTDALMRNLVLKNQMVFGTVNAGKEAFEAAVRDLGVFLDRWPHAIESLITGRFDMGEWKRLLTGPVQGIKNVIRVG